MTTQFVLGLTLGWLSLRRMGHLDEVRCRVENDRVYGVIEGPLVEFLDER